MKLTIVAFLCFLGLSLNATAELSPAVKGKFYVFIDDDIHLYLNGAEIFVSESEATAETKELELKPGDRIVARLKNHFGGRGLLILFVSSDKKKMMSFSHNVFKALSDPDATDFTPEQFGKGRKITWTKNWERKPFPYKHKSELVWGETDICTLASAITAPMFQPGPQ